MIFSENSAIVECSGRRVLFLDAAHLHAEVLGVADCDDALGAGRAHNLVANLGCQTLLHLQTTGEDIDDAGHLTKTDNLAVRYVTDGNATEKREYVMLAHRIELDVLDNHHLRAVMGEESLLHKLRRVDAIPLRKIIQSLGSADRRFDKAFALGIFAEQGNNFFDMLRNQLDALLCIVV